MQITAAMSRAQHCRYQAVIGTGFDDLRGHRETAQTKKVQQPPGRAVTRTALAERPPQSIISRSIEVTKCLCTP